MTKRAILFTLVQLNTDPVQYKPFSPTLTPDANNLVKVEIPLDTRYIIEDDADGVVITLEGLQALMVAVAKTVHDASRTYQDSLSGRSK